MCKIIFRCAEINWIKDGVVECDNEEAVKMTANMTNQWTVEARAPTERWSQSIRGGSKVKFNPIEPEVGGQPRKPGRATTSRRANAVRNGWFQKIRAIWAGQSSIARISRRIKCEHDRRFADRMVRIVGGLRVGRPIEPVLARYRLNSWAKKFSSSSSPSSLFDRAVIDWLIDRWRNASRTN